MYNSFYSLDEFDLVGTNAAPNAVANTHVKKIAGLLRLILMTNRTALIANTTI